MKWILALILLPLATAATCNETSLGLKETNIHYDQFWQYDGMRNGVTEFRLKTDTVEWTFNIDEDLVEGAENYIYVEPRGVYSIQINGVLIGDMTEATFTATQFVTEDRQLVLTETLVKGENTVVVDRASANTLENVSIAVVYNKCPAEDEEGTNLAIPAAITAAGSTLLYLVVASRKKEEKK